MNCSQISDNRSKNPGCPILPPGMPSGPSPVVPPGMPSAPDSMLPPGMPSAPDSMLPPGIPSGPGPVIRPELSGFPIGMGYVPIQSWETLYPVEYGFQHGTIFPSLDYPFVVGRCWAWQG